MKVSKRAPDAMKMPVEVTPELYQMWYMPPINLGDITKVGHISWETANGMQFKNSNLALDYLIDHWRKAAEEFLPQIQKRYEERLREAAPGQVASKNAFRGRGSEKKPKAVVNKKMSREEAAIFEKFKKFMSAGK